MSEINCDCGYNYTQTGCPNRKHIPVDYTEEYEQALANMQREYDKRGERIRELEKQNASLEAKLEMLIDTLRKSAEGWDNVIGMGLIAKKHFGSARVLRDEALEALQRVGVKL